MGFYPFGKLIDSHYQMGVASGCLLHGSEQVESSDREWPRDGDVLQRLCRLVGVSSIELAALALVH